MKKILVLITIVSFMLIGYWWNKKDKIVTIPKITQNPVIEEVEVKEPEEKSEVKIETEEELEETIKIIPIEDVETFIEVVDEGDSDEMLKPATKEEVEARESEEDKASRVKVRRIVDATYRDEMGANEVGLDYREFDRETFDEVYGIRPILLYFTQDNCVECEVWDELLKNNADKLEAVNALVLKADFDTDTRFREEYRVDGVGSALYFSTMGEVMGQVKNPDIESIVKFFGRFKQP